MRRVGILALAAAVSACAYFNGLYNANRLANDARSAEADGRTGAARSLWQQAAVKAESVAVRYPASKHRDDALLLMGEALSEIGECRRAVPPLRTAVDETPEAALRRRARLALGRCLVIVGRPDSAVDALGPLAAGAPPFADAARLWRGRAYMALGRYGLAITDLRQVASGDAAFDLALAYLTLDSLEAAHDVLGSKWSAPYAEERWADVLDAMELSAARARLVDSLAGRSDFTSGQRSRLFLAEARRLALEGRLEAAEVRFRRATEAASDSAAGRAAGAERALIELRRTTDLDRLGTLAGEMERAVLGSVQLTWPAGRFAALLRTITAALVEAPRPYDDLRLFRLAELMRDSVGARPLAGTLFGQVHERHPDSPIAPKALLAEAELGSAPPEQTVLLLERRYPDSPYARVLRGDPAPEFLALEDSLRTLLRRIARGNP